MSHKLSTMFNTIGILSKLNEPSLIETLEKLAEFLHNSGKRAIFDQECPQSDKLRAFEHLPRHELKNQCQLIIAVGGDGTLLSAARCLAHTDIPLIGVNRGRLGFLVDISPEVMCHHLEAMLSGEFKEEKRFLLQAEVQAQNKPAQSGVALNDVVLHIRGQVRMIEFEIAIDGYHISTQRADGLIIATPTGSTAYALSSGGPILHPSLDAITLVPICPHTLSHRPIVVDSQSELFLTLRDTEAVAYLSFDGQENIPVAGGDSILIRRHTQQMTLLHPNDYNYYKILQAKLRWAETP